MNRLTRFVSFTFVLAGIAVLSSPAGQTGHEGHQGGSPLPREILERPVALRTGIGTLHEEVTTSSHKAQAFYDQGLAYVHSYVWIEAIRSFHQALRLDPNMAMAFLGLTDAYLSQLDPVAARAAFERAKSLAPKVSGREQMWVAIRNRELDYVESNGDEDKYVAYRKSISGALREYPNDPWFWIQRGLAEEGSPVPHGQAGGVDSIAFYRMALALAPDNFAAHHYYTHTLENLGRTKEALDEAAIYVRMAPEIPHAHHMLGHELMRLGRTEEAIAEFVKTKSLEEEYYRTQNIPSRYDWHHAHNLQLLAMSYQSLGQMTAAEAAFREAFALPASTDFLEFNRKAWPEFLLARGRYEEALRAAQELSESEWPLPRLAGCTLAGEALLAMGRPTEAQEELNLAKLETGHVARDFARFPSTLRAELLLHDKKIEEAEPLLRNIVAMILAQPGPDAWSASRFELEAISKTARRSGDWNLSESVARDMIEHDPTFAGGYFALGLAAEHAGRAAEAHEQFVAAEKFWSKADKDLPELRRIQEGLSARR